MLLHILMLFSNLIYNGIWQKDAYGPHKLSWARRVKSLINSVSAKVKAIYDLTCSWRGALLRRGRFQQLSPWDSVPRTKDQVVGLKMRNAVVPYSSSSLLHSAVVRSKGDGRGVWCTDAQVSYTQRLDGCRKCLHLKVLKDPLAALHPFANTCRL